jgi:hypothetical protein
MYPSLQEGDHLLSMEALGGGNDGKIKAREMHTLQGLMLACGGKTLTNGSQARKVWVNKIRYLEPILISQSKKSWGVEQLRDGSAANKTESS